MPSTIPERAVRPSDLPPAQREFLSKYRTWQRFHHGPRQEQQPLTRALASYPDAVLVAGCQRSGTTMLTRVIAGAKSFRPLALTHDDELDAALALSAYIDLPRDTRYCLQTTYLNERYPEYQTLGPGQRLIWVLRNPASVVYSMVYNWKRWALWELYESSRATAAARVPGIDPPAGIGTLWQTPRTQKGIVSYVGKSAQILEIARWIGPDRLLIVDYDEVVQGKGDWFPRIFDFIGEPYDPAYVAKVRSDSEGKATGHSASLRERVTELATPTYEECRRLRSPLRAAA
jgi:hypothetical protein